MALITIPSAPEKGVPQTYTLNVPDLIALISDPYFQQQTNWSKVVALYQSSVSNQIEAITFIPDGVSTTLSVDAEFSLNARDVFNLNSIMIIDDQNGRNITYAASIPDVANYTIDFSVVPPEYIVWDNLYQGAATNSTGKLYKGSARDIYSSTDTNARASNPIGPFGGIFEMKFVISRTDSFGVKVGLAFNSLSNSNMYLSVAALNGNLTLNNVDINNANFPSSLGTYDINTDFEIRIKVSAGLIEVFKDGLAVGSPQMWLVGSDPEQMFIAAANVSQLASPSENVNTEVAILKSSTRLSV